MLTEEELTDLRRRIAEFEAKHPLDLSTCAVVPEKSEGLPFYCGLFEMQRWFMKMYPELYAKGREKVGTLPQTSDEASV